jgi:hypothetical protein
LPSPCRAWRKTCEEEIKKLLKKLEQTSQMSVEGTFDAGRFSLQEEVESTPQPASERKSFEGILCLAVAIDTDLLNKLASRANICMP